MYRHLLLSIRSKESQVWIRPSMSLAANVQIWSNSEAVPARLHWLYSFHCKRLVLVWGQPFYVKVSEIAEISTYCADSSWLTFWTCRLQTCSTFCHARSEAHTIWHPTYRFSNVSKSSCRKMSLWRNTVDAQLEKFVMTHDSQKGCLAQFLDPPQSLDMFCRSTSGIITWHCYSHEFQFIALWGSKLAGRYGRKQAKALLRSWVRKHLPGTRHLSG